MVVSMLRQAQQPQAQRPPKIDFPVKTTVFVDFFHGRFDASMLRQAQQPQGSASTYTDWHFCIILNTKTS